MAKIVEVEALKTCPLGGLFKFILKVVSSYLPAQGIRKNKFDVPGDQFENIFGLWR